MRVSLVAAGRLEQAFAIKQDGYRSVVDQLDLHHDAEDAAGDAQALAAQRRQETLTERLGHFRRGASIR